ncbi:hypothetical protein BD414DRAFT_577567 [Trametes punicea]|nr:hypothetical protein BD414DRAFT_577567 [Trametes punicea]
MAGPSSLPPNVLAALHAVQSNIYRQSQLAVDSARMQALSYSQQPQGWPGLDSNARMGHAPAGIAQLPSGATTQSTDYSSVPRHIAGQQQLQPQQILTLQQQGQAQLLRQPAAFPQTAYQHVHPQLNTGQAKDPFVYVQPEVRETVVDPAVVERIQKRALFVAPPFARLRTAQACERCRNRKTKCSGEKPKCKRCEKRGFDCVYVWEHRANRTKKAIAERERAARLAQEDAAALYSGQRAMMDALPPCLPTSTSSSSEYSAIAASSLPPPLIPGLPHGQLICPQAGPSYSSSSDSSGSSFLSSLPTPAIMLDGRPLAGANMLFQAPASLPVSRSPASSQTPSALVNSAFDCQPVSRSRSAMSLQYPELPPPKASASCEACVSEMSHCMACIEEKDSTHVQQHATGTQRSRWTPVTFGAPTPVSTPVERQPFPQEQLMTALSQALAKQAAERAMTASPDVPLATLVPRLARDTSSSSSTSEAQSGAQTPLEYFTYSQSSLPGPSSLVPAVESAMKISESMAMANPDGFHGIYSSCFDCAPQEPVYPRDDDGALQFSDIFHSFSSAPGSMQSILE